MKQAEMNVERIASTMFESVTHPKGAQDLSRMMFDKNLGDAESLIEVAGRACYESWDNESGKTNEEYIRNMLNHGHFSVIEHSSATFYITGVSRSLTHELVRHRHLQFSQRSQRYVNEDESALVIPFDVLNDAELEKEFVELVEHSQRVYRLINEKVGAKYEGKLDKTSSRKIARQTARSVLPNAVETRIVVTGNFRAWRHFIKMRASEAADVEIRALAIAILRDLNELCPAVFGDYQVLKAQDGTEYAKAGYNIE